MLKAFYSGGCDSLGTFCLPENWAGLDRTETEYGKIALPNRSLTFHARYLVGAVGLFV